MLRRAGSPVPRRGRHATSPSRTVASHRVTAREHEVPQLVGQGLDNRGVASRLVISPGTVEKHVEHLLAKTGLTTRTELVAFAARTDSTA
jgi:DNA-binding NarL/FixJ family response regulator